MKSLTPVPEADMTGFHIRELSRPAEQFKDGYRRIVYIDHYASTIARHVFQLTTSFHHAAGDIEGQFFLVSISFILLAGFDKPTQIAIGLAYSPLFTLPMY